MVARDRVQDYLFRGTLEELDPDVADLVRHETARQAQYLILIASESTVPQAVRETLASAFHNVYAEGYPLESSRKLSQDQILDYNARLPEFRRVSDERYYKGTEYADVAEALARRRCAELFAANGYSADDLYVNVQPLSGAPANNAVYTALVSPGDTVMGMDLIEGGHLSHGSPVNRSGKYYNIVSYGIDPKTGKLDYDEMLAIAQEHKPKLIIGGYSSYPYAPDWHKYREIADAVGAYVLADVAHVAGLVIAGVYPNPVGIADVVSFTTHKTLNGPRGACIITHRKDLSPKIDRGVFPGEQGGPHINTIAAIAVAFKLAATEQFRQLQHQIVRNASRLASKLAERGLTIPYGGTDTHLFTVDMKSVVGPDGTPLSGDMAARILDLAGIVVNRQTIPGDTSALRPSGIRIGTPWVTQRGFGDVEINTLGDIMADIVLGTIPFSYAARPRPVARAKIDFDLLQEARLRIRDLANSVGIDTDVEPEGYPHFHYLEQEADRHEWQSLLIQSADAAAFLNTTLASNVYTLKSGDQQPTRVLNPDGDELAHGTLQRTGQHEYRLTLNHNINTVGMWLRSLSDGFVQIDRTDPYSRVAGPVDVRDISPDDQTTIDTNWDDETKGYATNKPYFIGIYGKNYAGPKGKSLPKFTWEEQESAELLKTSLHSLHQELGAKMVPFAGYDMPVWYTSVTQEHMAVRTGSGIFDVTHMGVFDVQGPGAAAFLDVMTTNDVIGLAVGDSHYTYLLDVDGIPLDDLMIYRLAETHFLVVVNASNNDKNWAWLKSVKNHTVMIDPEHPYRTVNGENFILRDLRDRSVGKEMRVDLALQGPKSKEILLSLGGLDEDKQAVSKLSWAGITQVTLGGFDLIVSRTGYTGERTAYELFVHPDQAAALFKRLVDAGVTPCGLAARDSLRTEAGLPLYGHELAGDLNLNPADAGFPTYVKLWKPFFVGKAAYIAHELKRDAHVVRFRVNTRGARPPHQGDPLVDTKGRVVGIVTSCSIDSEGYQLGQAYVKNEFTAKDTQLGIFSGAGRTKATSFDQVTLGSKLPVPESVTILSRFPSAKK